MRNPLRFVILCLCMLGSVATARAASSSLKPADLRCEYLVDPLGMDETAPRLSWMLESSKRGDKQSAYQVLVASSPEGLTKDQGDLWDSAKVSSDENAHVLYEGKPLTSQLACYWKVRVWSAAGEQSDWSGPAKWTMGLLKKEDWEAKWIDSSEAIIAEAAKDPVTILHATYEPVPQRKRNPKAAAPAASEPVESVDVTVTLAGWSRMAALR